MTPDQEAALRRAAMDRRLQWITLRVFAFLLPDLSQTEFRAVKLLVVGQQLHVHKAHVSRSLQFLVANGYLEVGPAQDRVNSYRLSEPVGGVKKLMVPPDATNSSSEGLVA